MTEDKTGPIFLWSVCIIALAAVSFELWRAF